MKKALVLLAIVAVVAWASVGAAQGDYSVSVSGPTTDVPSTDVSFGGNTHTVTRVAVREPGDSVTVDADAPEGETYDVNLYNSDGDVVLSSRKRGGSTTTTFDLSCCEPGTYGVTLYDSEVKDLAGVVVAGYDVDVRMPSSAEQGTTVTTTVTLNDIGGGSVESVAVVLIGGGDTVVTEAELQRDSTYEATISLDNVATGSYDVYGVVFGPDTFDNGQHELIGLQNAPSFTVETDDGSDGSGSSGGDTPTDTDTATPTETPTPSDNGTTETTETRTTTSAPTDTASLTPTDTTTDGDATTTATPTDGGTTEDTATGDTAGDGGGFSFTVALVALLAAFIAIRE